MKILWILVTLMIGSDVFAWYDIHGIWHEPRWLDDLKYISCTDPNKTSLLDVHFSTRGVPAEAAFALTNWGSYSQKSGEMIYAIYNNDPMKFRMESGIMILINEPDKEQGKFILSTRKGSLFYKTILELTPKEKNSGKNDGSYDGLITGSIVIAQDKNFQETYKELKNYPLNCIVVEK